MIPEGAHLIGQKVELSLNEFVSAAKLLRRVLDNLIQAIEKKNIS